MTTINDITDLIKIPQEKPEWAKQMRAILLTEDLLELPKKFGEIDAKVDGLNTRMQRTEGHLGNLVGSNYERALEAKVLSKAMLELDMEHAHVALNQHGTRTAGFESAMAAARETNRANQPEIAELHETDLIVSADGNRHLVCEVSVTADTEDIRRARARADIMVRLTRGQVSAAVITTSLHPAQAAEAQANNVTVWTVPYR